MHGSLQICQQPAGGDLFACWQLVDSNHLQTVAASALLSGRTDSYRGAPLIQISVFFLWWLWHPKWWTPHQWWWDTKDCLSRDALGCSPINWQWPPWVFPFSVLGSLSTFLLLLRGAFWYATHLHNLIAFGPHATHGTAHISTTW